jgi:HK97 family phage portal protein
MFDSTKSIARRSLASIFGITEGVLSAIGRVGIRGGLVLAASGVMVSAESAMLVSAYKRGVELLAHHVAKTPYCVKRGCEMDTSHPASPVIRWWARHHQMSAFEFRRTMMVIALTRGNSYAYIVRRAGVVTELLLLDSQQVQPEVIRGKLVYRVSGRDKFVSPSDMMHIKGLGFNGYEGLDPIRYYAKEVLGLAIATQNYAAKYYENGGTPSAYLKSEVPLTDDQFNRLKGEAGPLKRSVDNPHELPILEQTDIKSVGLTAEQTQLLGARKDIILDIANLLGIPPHKLGLAISTSYGSLEEENDAFRDDALDPWLVQFEMEYRKLLTEDEQQGETHTVAADRSDFSRMKSADQAQYLKDMTGGSAVMTVNEARARLGLPPVQGGDVLMRPLNMAAAGEDPEEPADDSQASETEQTDTEASDAEIGDVADGEESDVETETDDAAESRSRIHAAKLRALEDVFNRMTKRLTTAAGKIKRPEQLVEFRSRLDTDHLQVITAALSPIVPLCGGTEAGPFALELVTAFRSRLDSLENAPDLHAAVESLGETFVQDAGQFASEALRKMVA